MRLDHRLRQFSPPFQQAAQKGIDAEPRLADIIHPFQNLKILLPVHHRYMCIKVIRQPDAPLRQISKGRHHAPVPLDAAFRKRPPATGIKNRFCRFRMERRQKYLIIRKEDEYV